ncbi:hypothetical protein HOO68_00890 [Candidatus Gracilibacteria bacterium]|nr:hypothetical protein [Candidatus Gracilibacteria bacterium]
MQFQATCSKGNKKLTLTLNADTLDSARNILHAQGYSIIEINENTDENILSGNFFYFDAKVNGILQSGKIQSNDIFKSYKKLIEDLKYDVIYIYSNEGMPEESKKLITAKVKDGYRLYKESIGEDMDEEEELKLQTADQQEMGEISGDVLKEIAKYGTVIDSSIEKIQNLFLKYHETITHEQKIGLENLENLLVQTKGTKNLGKISSTVENGLRIIGETELALLKTGMTEEKQKFLDETNALLKQVGSKNRMESEEEKKNSITYKINNFFASKVKEKAAPEKEKKDVNSFIYFKNKRELDTYKKKLGITDMDIVKAIFTLQFSQFKKLFLKRKLISQNIEIINNRLNNRVVSYTKMIHGFEYYVNNFVKTIELIVSVLTYAIFFYTIALIILHTLNNLNIFSSQINDKTILFVTITSIIAFLLTYIRGVISAIILIPSIAIIIFFISINF